MGNVESLRPVDTVSTDFRPDMTRQVSDTPLRYCVFRRATKKYLTFARSRYILGTVNREIGSKTMKKLYSAYYWNFGFAFFYEGTTSTGFAEPLQ